MELYLYVPLHVLRAAVHALLRTNKPPLLCLETLDLTILRDRNDECRIRGCDGGHRVEIARAFGEQLRSMLDHRASAMSPSRRLKKLRVNQCMVVEGLEDYADKFEVESCDCEVIPVCPNIRVLPSLA